MTIHVGGERGECGIAEIREVVSTLRPDRIGHGILAARDKRLMGHISRPGSCSSSARPRISSLRALESEEALRDTFRAFAGCHAQFTIATDGPEMMRTHLRDEFELLLAISALDESQVSEANRRGHEASFIPHKPLVQRA